MTTIKKNKFAVIDLGSNTFHVVIFEYTNKKLTVLARKRTVVKIGEGIENRILTKNAQLRGLDALIIFKKLIDDYSINTIKAFATSAFRNADNSSEFLAQVKESTGIEIDIISGDREAELIYKGVREEIEFTDGNSMIMDIGGGSVEFIICNKEQILFKKSYEIGGLRLMQRFHQHEPILKSEIEALNTFLNTKLGGLFEAINTYQPHTLLGASGTFESLVSIHSKRNHDYESLQIPFSFFHEFKEEIILSTKEDRLNIAGLLPMRVEMIVVATLLIEKILFNSFTKIIATKNALKEGMAMEIIEQLHVQ